MTCQHQFHVMARAIWRVFPFPPGDAGLKHREAVSDALHAVGDYADTLAAQQAQPAHGLREAAVELVTDWREGSEYHVTDTGDEITEGIAVRGCADSLAAILDEHPESQVAPEPPECLASHCPPPGRECDYPECAPTAAELARFAAAGKPRRFVPVAEHAEYIKANQQLARSLYEATEPLLHGTVAEQKLGRELRERHGLEP